MAVTPVPNPPVVPKYPALGSPTFNQEAYAYGTAMPGVTQRIHEIAQAARSNAVESGAQAAAAAQERVAAVSETTTIKNTAVSETTAIANTARDYRDAAATSAGEALASANAAATSASEALARKNAAATSADAAEASRIAASKLNLGSKATAPTVDNQGEPLTAGATYYDTTLNKWRVWDGVSWAEGISALAGVASVDGKTGNLDLSDTSYQAATQAEMEAGTQAGLRSMSPLRVAQAIDALASPKVLRSARTSNVQLTESDNGKLIDITSGTFTQTFAAAAELGNGWFCYLKNSGTGDITLDPYASETIDGLQNLILVPGDARLLATNGVGFTSILISSSVDYREYRTSGVWSKPPGAKRALVEIINGGGANAGGLGGAFKQELLDLDGVADTVVVTVGAGSTGTSGGISSFGGYVKTSSASRAYTKAVDSRFDGGGIYGGAHAGTTTNDPVTNAAINPVPFGIANTTDRAAGASGQAGLNDTTYINNTTSYVAHIYSFTHGSVEYKPLVTSASGAFDRLLAFGINNNSAVNDVIPLGRSALGLWVANGNVFLSDTAHGVGSTTRRSFWWKPLSQVLASTGTWTRVIVDVASTDVSPIGGVCYWNGAYYVIFAGYSNSAATSTFAVHSSTSLNGVFAQTYSVSIYDQGQRCLGVATNSSGIVFTVDIIQSGSGGTVGTTYRTTNGSTWTAWTPGNCSQISRPITLASGLIAVGYAFRDSYSRFGVASFSSDLSATYSNYTGQDYSSYFYDSTNSPSIVPIGSSNSVYILVNFVDYSNIHLKPRVIKSTINASSNPTLDVVPSSDIWPYMNQGTTNMTFAMGGAYLPLSISAGQPINIYADKYEDGTLLYTLERYLVTESGDTYTVGSFSPILDNIPLSKKTWPLVVAGGNGFGGGAGGAPGALGRFRFLGGNSIHATSSGGSGFVRIWSWR